MKSLAILLVVVSGVIASPRNISKNNVHANEYNHHIIPKISLDENENNGNTLNSRAKTDYTETLSKIEHAENKLETKHADKQSKKTDMDMIHKEAIDPISKCSVLVRKKSIKYFQGQLLQNEPHFVQFSLQFPNGIIPNNTLEVFEGKRWFWTHNTSAGPLPFISWNLDYGLLSFGLLDAKTIHIPYIELKEAHNSTFCNLTLGSNNTSRLLTKALVSLVNSTKDSEIDEFIKYRESYFCYLVADHKLRGTLRYFAAQYFMYPCSYIRYKCCAVFYSYSSSNYSYSCPDDGNVPGLHSWAETSHIPAFIVILIIAFCPIPLFHYFAWLSKRDKAYESDYVPIDNDIEGFELVEEEDNWIYADGKQSPLTFYDLFTFDIFGMYDKYPILTSRLRRSLLVMIAPTIIIIKVIWYDEGLGMWHDDNKITVNDLIKAGTPMGFLSIKVDPLNEHKTFVPGLGGALSISIMYYVLGFLFMVFPRSVKQVVEDGLPGSNLYLSSPLFFGYKEILKMSKVNVEPAQLEAGYLKGASLMKCSFYLLFNSKFWIRLWRIQSRRISCMGGHQELCLCVLWLFIFPFYFTFCIVEIAACLLYYGVPFCFFVVVMVKGAIKSLRYLRDQSRVLSVIFSYKFCIAIGVLIVFVMFSLLAYIVCLVFVASFGLITQVIALCFMAVIIYPSVAFGYLFFIVIVLYFFIKQIRNFSDVYADLLSTAIEISKRIAEEPYRVALTDGYISITNINCEALKGIKINETVLDENSTAMFLFHDDKQKFKIRKKNHVFGIPKGLFDYLVQKHRPVHKSFLNLLFRVSIMIAFVNVTLSISSNYASGPTSEISEVMHVIFIVVVGVIPQLIGIAFANSNSALVSEIEERKIEETIVEYWSTK